MSTWMLLAALAPQGGLPFDAAEVVFPHDRDPVTALGDFDGDGDVDLFTSFKPAANQGIRIGLRLNVSGTFAYDLHWFEEIQDVGPQTLFPGEDRFVVGRIDADALDDLVYANGTFVRLYRGATIGALIEVQTIQPLPTVRDVALADIDGDGSAELAVLTESNLRIYDEAGGLWWLSASVPLVAIDTGTRLLALEASGDQAQDLVAVTPTDLRLYLSIGGTPVHAGAVAHGVADPMPAAGDVDGNGRDDVVLFGASEYRVFRQTAPGVFQLGTLATGGPATALADVDLDGDLDGICCGGGTGNGLPSPNLDFQSIFEISLNDGGGGFAPAFQILGVGATQIAGAADLDQDGWPDLAAGRAIVWGDGFRAFPRASTGLASVDPALVADMEADGDPDLSLSLSTCMRNAGDGSFASQPMQVEPAPAGTSWEEPALAGDFTGDGAPDLLVTQRAGAALLGVRLLVNRGGTLFDAGPAAPAGVPLHPDPDGPLRGQAVDVDDDGDLDLIATSFTPPQGSLIWRNDAGTFTPVLDLTQPIGNPFFQAWFVIGVADFTGDELTDLLVHGATGWEIHPGQGGGGFGTPYRPFRNNFAFDNPSAFNYRIDRMVVEDMNEDGWTDVIVVDRGDGTGAMNQLRFLANQGPADPGYFGNTGFSDVIDTVVFPSTGQAVFYGGFSVPREIHAADVDGDGRRDLVVRPVFLSPDSTLVIRNTGPDPFAWEKPRILAMTPGAILDVDGDGDPDAVGSEVVANRTYDGTGDRVQYGSAFAGTAGVAPTLGSTGPARVGAASQLRLRGTRGATTTFLALSTQQGTLAGFPQPGLTSWVDPAAPIFLVLALPASGPPGLAGAGGWTLPLVAPPAAALFPLYHQVFAVDPSAPSGLSATNGLLLRYEP